MDQPLRLERQFPAAPVLFTLITLALLVAGFLSQGPHPVIAGALPLLLAVWLWSTRPKEASLEFGPEAVSVSSWEIPIEYENIVGLTVGGRTPAADGEKIRAGELVLSEQDRIHSFPQLSLNAARQAYTLLLDRIPETGSREVSTALRQRLENDLQLFDDDLVFSYRARLDITPPRTRARALFAVLLAVSVVWLAVGTIRPEFDVWLAMGSILLVISVIGGLATFAARNPYGARMPELLSSSLIISPRGLALYQGPLKGELKWDEVQSLECGKVASGTLVIQGAPRAIAIKVAGAQILIHDIYDRPLATIHRCLQRYWESR